MPAMEIVMPSRLHKGSKSLSVDIVLDTGSVYSVIPLKLCDNAALKPSKVQLIAANCSEIPVACETCVNFVADGVRLTAFVL
jgi:predicted aspartyl protease